MHRTSILITEEQAADLKEISNQYFNTGASALIREAIAQFIKNHKIKKETDEQYIKSAPSE